MKKLALLVVVGVGLWNISQWATCPENQVASPAPIAALPPEPPPPPLPRRHRIEIRAPRHAALRVVQIPDPPMAPAAEALPPAVFVEPAPPPEAVAPVPPLQPEADLTGPDSIGEDEVPAGPPPAWFAENVKSPKSISVPNGLLTIKGRHASTKDRADTDARVEVDRAVADWIRPEVPRSWVVPRPLVDGLIRDRYNEWNDHEYGVTFKTGYRVDFSPEHREEIINVYLKQLGMQRLVLLGGGLGFILICLGAVSGYIRADEATKGYYTNRLRMAAAVGVGAAGMAIYQLLS